jgi:AbrB family looped-hinge helix DNA binding protein
MTSATISAKGQIVIPAEYRRKYDLQPGDKVQIVDYGGVLAIVPVPKDPIEAGYGLLKSPKSLTQALLEEHTREQQRQPRKPGR